MGIFSSVGKKLGVVPDLSVDPQLAKNLKEIGAYDISGNPILEPKMVSQLAQKAKTPKGQQQSLEIKKNQLALQQKLLKSIGEQEVKKEQKLEKVQGIFSKVVQPLGGSLAKEIISYGLEKTPGKPTITLGDTSQKLIGAKEIKPKSQTLSSKLGTAGLKKAGFSQETAQKGGLFGSVLLGGFLENPFLGGTGKVGKELLEKTGKKLLSEEVAEAATKVGNLNLEKFDLPNEAKQNISEIIKNNAEFLEQRRGVLPFYKIEQLAQSITPKLKMKKGTALNAEELQSLGDTVANLQMKVDDFAKQVNTPEGNTDLNILRLEQSKQELAYALSSLSGATAEAGRSLGIMRNIRQAIATNDLDLIQKAMKLSGGRESAEALAKALLNAPDDLAKIKIIRDVTKIKNSEKVYEVWLNSILSNPVTHAVNVTSNALRALLEVPVRLAEATFQKPKSREVFFGEIPEQLVGFVSGISEGMGKAMFVLKNGITSEMVTKLDIGRLPAIKGKVGDVVRTPTKFLTAADEFFKAIGRTSELRSRAYRMARKEGLDGEKAIVRMHELIDNPPIELFEAAKRKSEEITFQEDLGKNLSKLMKLRNDVPGLKYIIPFLRTPINITKQAVEFSPFGFLKTGIKKATKQYESAPKGKMREEIAKATIGSIISAGILLPALRGNLIGSAPKSAAERDAFYRSGKQPYSIKLGNRWISYQKLEPLSTVIGSIADIVHITKEEGINKAAQSVAAVIGKNLQDKTFLSGISAITEALTDETKRAHWLANMVSGLAPFSGTQRFISRNLDTTIRKPEGVLQTVMAQTPGLSSKVPPLRNVFGEEVKRTRSQINSPIPVTKEVEDIVDGELERLKVTVGFPSKSIQGVKLEQKEYDKYLKVSGTATKKVIFSLIKSPQWIQMTDSQKEKVLRKVTDRVRERTREKMFPKHSRANDIRKELESRGLSEEEVDKVLKKILQSSPKADKESIQKEE